MESEEIRRIEELVARVESISDRQARDLTIELLRAVMDLHAAGLERILAIAKLDTATPDPCTGHLASIVGHTHSRFARKKRGLGRRGDFIFAPFW